MSLHQVDLNCDLGESFGAYHLGNDEAILPFFTSANIACGFHAGDPAIMKKTVHLALENKVAIGAHPGFPDLVGFGRRNLAISPTEAYDLVVYQIGALWAFVQAAGGVLHHVKPHGALYNMAAQNKDLAEAIAEAIYKVDARMILYGLANSELILAGQKIGLKVAQEVFADRTYQPNGTLTPRHLPQALILDPAEAVKQVIRMITQNKVLSQTGEAIPIQADTVCIHGDGPHALNFATHLHQALTRAGITVQTINP